MTVFEPRLETGRRMPRVADFMASQYLQFLGVASCLCKQAIQAGAVFRC
jgi:hypothetical protein